MLEEPYQKKKEEPGMTLNEKKDVCFRKDIDTIPTKWSQQREKKFKDAITEPQTIDFRHITFP